MDNRKQLSKELRTELTLLARELWDASGPEASRISAKEAFIQGFLRGVEKMLDDFESFMEDVER